MYNSNILQHDLPLYELRPDKVGVGSEVIGFILKNHMGKISLVINITLEEYISRKTHLDNIRELALQKCSENETGTYTSFGELAVSASSAALLVNKTVQTIYYWHRKGKLKNLNAGKDGKKLFSVQEVLDTSNGEKKG